MLRVPRKQNFIPPAIGFPSALVPRPQSNAVSEPEGKTSGEPKKLKVTSLIGPHNARVHGKAERVQVKASMMNILCLFSRRTNRRIRGRQRFDDRRSGDTRGIP